MAWLGGRNRQTGPTLPALRRAQRPARQLGGTGTVGRRETKRAGSRDGRRRAARRRAGGGGGGGGGRTHLSTVCIHSMVSMCPKALRLPDAGAFAYFTFMYYGHHTISSVGEEEVVGRGGGVSISLLYARCCCKLNLSTWLVGRAQCGATEAKTCASARVPKKVCLARACGPSFARSMSLRLFSLLCCSPACSTPHRRRKNFAMPKAECYARSFFVVEIQ